MLGYVSACLARVPSAVNSAVRTLEDKNGRSVPPTDNQNKKRSSSTVNDWLGDQWMRACARFWPRTRQFLPFADQRTHPPARAKFWSNHIVFVELLPEIKGAVIDNLHSRVNWRPFFERGEAEGPTVKKT